MGGEKGSARQIVYIDMDEVLVDFDSGLARVPARIRAEHESADEIPGIYGLMEPKPGAVEAFHELSRRFDVFVLSTAPWKNPSAWSDKVEWVKRYLGDAAYKRLILTHHKDLNRGDFLIDDRLDSHGAGEFRGRILSFGPQGEFKDWDAVMEYMRSV